MNMRILGLVPYNIHIDIGDSSERSTEFAVAVPVLEHRTYKYKY
jgi:hypothetical protein